MNFWSKQDLLAVMTGGVVVLLFFGPVVVSTAQEQPDAKLYFTEVPAEESGLTHEINSDPEKYGTLKYQWMSPPVDIDGDGHLDIIYYGHHGGSGPGDVQGPGGAAAVWLGKGDGTFVFDERGYHRRWMFAARDPVWIDLTGNGAMDGIVTEWASQGSRVMLNDGTGHWQSTDLRMGEMFIDTNGDGRFDGLWSAGKLLQMEPPLWQWEKQVPEKLTLTQVLDVEEVVGWPKGVTRSTRFMGFREAYSVDLTGDHRNELVFNFKGDGGFDSSELYSWVLTRTKNSDGQETWIDTTARRGLPTDVGHCLYPEDVDADGHMDLVDLESGHWYQNDGQGKFTRSPHRIYDPETRDRGRYVAQRGRPWTPDDETFWVDLTNNGYRDLATSTDHGQRQGVFLNAGGGRFLEVDGFGNRRHRKFGDLTGNHKLDLIRNVPATRVTLFRNDTPLRGMHIKVVPNSPAEASLGVKVWVYEAGGLGDQQQLIHYRQGFMERRPSRSNVIGTDLHVGLGERDAVDVRVRFPSGIVREVRGTQAETRVTLHEAP